MVLYYLRNDITLGKSPKEMIDPNTRTDHCVPPILRNIPVRGILLLLCLLYVMDLNSIQTIH
jgi:hypothetical protein